MLSTPVYAVPRPHARVRYAAVRRCGGARRKGTRAALCRDGQAVWTTNNDWQLFRQLEWQRLLFASTAIDDRLLIHAGAVARSGQRTLLPGRSESGTSTLTLALVLRGYAYYHPAELQAQAVGDRVAVERIGFPRDETQAETRLEALEPGETMRRLVENAVNFAHLGPAGLKLLARLSRRCVGYSLVSSSPEAAGDAVASLD